MNKAGVYALQSESPLIYPAMEEQVEIDAVFAQNAKLTFISTNDGALIRQLQLSVPKAVEIASFSTPSPTLIPTRPWKSGKRVDAGLHFE